MSARRFLLPRAASLAAAVLLTGACGTMAPRHERPAAPVPDRFPVPAGVSGAPALLPAAGPAAADLPWQDFFVDPALRRLIGLALAGNRDLRLAVIAIEQARATAQVRDADLWPTLNAGLAMNRQPTASGGSTRLFTAGLQVTAWELDLLGRLRSASDAAAAQLLASAESRNAVQTSLVANVANSWIALRADETLLRVTRQTLRTREATYALTRLRFDNGASSELELRAAESLRESARAALAQQVRQRALDENALALLLGQPVPADLLAALSSDAAAAAAAPAEPEAIAPIPPLRLPALPELPPGLPAEVLTRRPDVRQAELQLVAANANIGAARAAFFPRITLTGSAGVASSALDQLFSGGSFAWSFAPQLLQTIFDGGRNRGNLRIAQANRDAAVAQYERAIQSAFREVADALAGRATLGEQLGALQAQLQAEQGRFALTELRYRNGASSYLDMLDAQRSLFAAQQSLVQAQVLLAQNGVALYRVLGGGWSPAQAP